jgi:hypothetical protein
MLMLFNWLLVNLPHSFSSFLFIKKYLTWSSVILVKSTTVLQQDEQCRPCWLAVILSQFSWQGVGMVIFSMAFF